MLTEMLNQSNSLDELPIPQKRILYTLAHRFQESTKYLFYNPEELVAETGLGDKDTWTNLLNLQETKNFVKSQMAFLAQISQRKTFASLVEMAMAGNQQAAKQVQELSGVLNQQDTNRTIVLHQIPRPKNKEVQS